MIKLCLLIRGLHWNTVCINKIDLLQTSSTFVYTVYSMHFVHIMWKTIAIPHHFIKSGGVPPPPNWFSPSTFYWFLWFCSIFWILQLFQQCDIFLVFYFIVTYKMNPDINAWKALFCPCNHCLANNNKDNMWTNFED